MLIARLTALILLLAGAERVLAQRPMSAINGVAFDSLHNRPLVSATVTLIGTSNTTLTDSAGRFRLDAVPYGSHQIFVQHDAMDALGMSGLRATALVDSTARSVFVALPSFATLWRAACGRALPSSDSGLVFGTVRSASRGRPYRVSATWADLTFDKSAGLGRKGWKMETDADSLGNYALCGVPAFTAFSVSATRDTLLGEWIDAGIVEGDRILRRDLEISQSPAGQGKFTGLRGRVVDSTGTAVANAEVIIPDLGQSRLSDVRGEVSFDSITPGIHLVTVKRIGFAPMERVVTFRADRSTSDVFTLTRITILDSMSVKARSGPRDEPMRVFAENQKRGFGAFVTRTELDKHPGQKLSNVMAQLEGIFVMRGMGGQAWVTARRQPKRPSCLNSYSGPARRGAMTDSRLIACARDAGFYLPDEGEAATGMPLACWATVFVDGVVQNQTREPFDLNSVNVDDIQGVEWYSGITQIPIQYTRRYGNCGVLVLYSRWKR